MAERVIEGEEQGGEEMGHRIPLAQREEGTATAPEDKPEIGKETEAGPGDAGKETAPAEEVEVDEETLMDLKDEDIDLLIDQQELSVDKGLEEEEKKIEVAKALGYEVVIEEGGDPGSPEGTVEGLTAKVSDLNRELAMLRPAQELMRVLEEDPGTALVDLAEYYGVDIGTGVVAAGVAPAVDAQIVIPDSEPLPNESMPQYLARLMQVGFASMQKNLAATPAVAKKPATRPGAKKPHPQVVATLQYLDKHYPDWTQFESKMLDLVRVNPELMNDPDALYTKATGRTGGPAARAKAKARKITLKKAKTGERGGRAALKLARKGVKLDPSVGADFVKAWDLAKKQVEERGG